MNLKNQHTFDPGHTGTTVSFLNPSKYGDKPAGAYRKHKKSANII